MEGNVGLEARLRSSSSGLTAPDQRWTGMWVDWEPAGRLHRRKVALPESSTRGQNAQGRPGSEALSGGISRPPGPTASPSSFSRIESQGWFLVLIINALWRR